MSLHDLVPVGLSLMRKKPTLRIITVLLGVLALVSSCVRGAQEVPTVPHDLEPVAGPLLEVRELRVKPAIVRSGASVRVEATVVNRGTTPVYDLQLGVAFGNIGAADASWTPLNKRPSEPIKSLAPGEEVDFWEVVRVEGNGWFLVGIAGTATNAMLLPRGQKVQVVNPVALSTRAIALYTFYLILLGIAGAAVWVLTGWIKSKAIFVLNSSLLGFGLGVMATGLLWFGVFRYFAPRIQPQMLSWLPLGGVILFATGWVLIGAGLGPQGQAWRGMLLAVILYILIGIGWVTVFNVGLGAKFPEILLEPDFLLVALFWPLQVAQALGIFGLGFN